MITPGTTVNETPSGSNAEQQWNNPRNPEGAGDQRDLEQLERQKKEAELRKANLTEDDDKDKKETGQDESNSPL